MIKNGNESWRFIFLCFTTFFVHTISLDPLENNSKPTYFKIKYSVAKAILAVLAVTLELMLVIILIKYVRKNRQGRKTVQTKQSITLSSGLYLFSKAEIENAIGGGSNNNGRVCLGRGSEGEVYKGVLPSGQEVAIKRMHRRNKSDYLAGLSWVRHPNLVCLIGWYMEDDEQYLVYEYCSRGNLAQHLLRKDAVPTWERRVKILRDCALAIRFLHHQPDASVIHKNIKLRNILFTEKFETKLSDFGLAKTLSMDEPKVFRDLDGSMGYMDPEYMTTSQLTCASDVFCFGIVALQLLSGQCVTVMDLDARGRLTSKAKDVIMGKRPIGDMEDPRLNLNGNANYSEEFESILNIAVLCIAKSSEGRPSIDTVFYEMDKAWKNTLAHTQASLREMTGSSLAPPHRLPEMIPV